MKPVSIKIWIAHAFLDILILSMVLSAAANLYMAYDNNMEQRTELMMICSKNIQSMLNHQWGGLDELQKSNESDNYLEARKILLQLIKIYNLDDLYIYSVDPAIPSRYYYLCASSDAEKDRYMQGEMSLAARPAAEILPAEQELLTGERDLQQEYSEINKRYADKTNH